MVFWPLAAYGLVGGCRRFGANNYLSSPPLKINSTKSTDCSKVMAMHICVQGQGTNSGIYPVTSNKF